MGFRGKQIASLTLVAATVALTTSLVNLTSLARLTVTETRSPARGASGTRRSETMRGGRFAAGGAGAG